MKIDFFAIIQFCVQTNHKQALNFNYMCFTYNLVNEFPFSKMEMQLCSTKPRE